MTIAMPEEMKRKSFGASPEANMEFMVQQFKKLMKLAK